MLRLTSLYFICLFLLFASCKETSQKKKPVENDASQHSNTRIKRPSQLYTAYTDSIAKSLKNLQTQKNIPAIQKLLYHSIADEMPLYWHGTKWDFNGTTRTPGDSSIACGYFITTILDDIGLKVKRSWLAQQPSSVLIKTTCSNIKRYADFAELKKYLTNTPPYSIYIVGLDFHTGFIIRDKNNSWFFHSNYIGRAGVTKELVDESKALKNNKAFLIGNLTLNHSFLLK